jgi:hypothetical protein
MGCSSNKNGMKDGDSSGHNGRRRWRLIPLVTLTNWRNEEYYRPEIGAPLLAVRRFWGGRIIHVIVKHYDLCLDFRHSWQDDMRHGL